jgi:hypothetical protein
VSDRRSPEERFWKFVEAGDCWTWTGYVHPNGYGRFRVSAQFISQAHRFAYEMLVGPVPKGLELDHLCRVRACVNPDHLEPVPALINNRRGAAPSARAARHDLCRAGLHTPSVSGWYIVPGSGARRCRLCRQIASRRHHASRRARLAREAA